MGPNEISNIYISFKDASKGWLSLHHQHFTQFVFIILAVLTASIVALSQFQNNGWLLLLITIGPIINVTLCFTATKVCDRFYQRFLEHESVAMKLFLLSDLDGKFSNKKPKKEQLLFHKDTHLLPERWIDTMSNYENIDQFVEAYINQGSNKLIRRTFQILILLNVIICVAIVLFAVASFV